LDKFTQNIRIIPIDSDVAKHYGDIRAKLAKQGKIIGNNVLWEGAHVCS
jgi:predicted nucleic acid-binding protein